MSDNAQKGKEILKNQRAQGNPGQKQPAPANPQEQAKSTLKALDEMRVKTDAKPYESSAKRTEQSGNPHPVAPQDRKIGRGLAETSAADIASGHISAAKSAIENQLTSDARIMSDPRYQRDQEVYELAKTGNIGLVPPSDFELSTRAGGENSSDIPSSPEEQVADDMKRIDEAKKLQKDGATGVTTMPGSKPVPVGATLDSATKNEGGKSDTK